VAAGVAALVAHVAVDAIGDVAIARDAYDGMEHGSRGVVLLGLLTALVVLGLRVVAAAVGGAEGRARLRRALVAPASPLPMMVAASLASVIALVGMQSLDTLVATGVPGTLADALGGSPLLGLGVTVPLAALFGLLAWRALRCIAASRDALVRALGAMFVSSRVLPTVPATCGGVARRPLARRQSPLARRAAKRGPPVFLFA